VRRQDRTYSISKNKIELKIIPMGTIGCFFILKACFRRRSLSLLERDEDLEENSIEILFITGADGSGSLLNDVIDASIALLVETLCPVSTTE